MEGVSSVKNIKSKYVPAGDYMFKDNNRNTRTSVKYVQS